MGPTASGKTALAEALAEELDAQLINADASQAYIGMSIGTAKPEDTHRYKLLDLKTPDEQYGAGEFCRLASAELDELWDKGRSAVVVGGTGFYLRALFEQYEGLEDQPDPVLRDNLNRRRESEGLESLVQELLAFDPDAATRIDLKNPNRVTRALERAIQPSVPSLISLPPFRKIKLGLNPQVDQLFDRISTRVNTMMHNGWIQEVRDLLEAGYTRESPGFRAIGYSDVARYLDEEIELEEVIATTIATTVRYAKRQRTWLRSEPKLNILQSGEPELLARALNLVHGDF